MIVDVNVNLSRWPFRRLPCDETDQLAEKLRRHGVTQAWAGNFDGLLHKDIGGVNDRLALDCKRVGEGLLLPVGSVNPMLPDWQEDLRRCRQDHGMHAIRLHPNYHGYTLDHPVCDELFALAQREHLIVQLVLKMEDVRSHHPLMQIPTVNVAPLERLVAKYAHLRLVVMNNYGTIRGDLAARLVDAGQVYFDISHAERVGTLEELVRQIPFQRILFGSHFPFFNLEASLLKFRESQLGGLITEAIQRKNALRLTESAG